MKVETTPISGVRVFHAAPHGDDRGLFVETYQEEAFAAELGADVRFIQDAVSCSRAAGTLRGLHFQEPPFAQAKLVRVQKGRAFDVVVDLRQGQPTYGQHAAFDLSAGDWTTVFIPPGCAHGFCTLAENTEVTYKIAGPYNAAHGRGVLWNDPDLAIDWPVDPGSVVLSEADRNWPRLNDLDNPFD